MDSKGQVQFDVIQLHPWDSKISFNFAKLFSRSFFKPLVASPSASLKKPVASISKAVVTLVPPSRLSNVVVPLKGKGPEMFLSLDDSRRFAGSQQKC